MFGDSPMDPTVEAIFFVAAVVLFFVAAIGVAGRVNLVAAGLACFALPYAWNAFAAA